MHRITKYLIPIFLFGFLFAFAPSVFADTYIGEDIDTDTLWTTSGSPYIVNGDIYIYGNAILTIDAGVVVKFTGGSSLNVLGKLLVNGTEAQKVLFTSNFNDEFFGSTDDYESCGEEVDADGNPTGVEVCEWYDSADPSKNAWAGVFFSNSNESILNNLQITYAGDSAIEFYNSSATAENLEIKESISGVLLYEGSSLGISGASLTNLNKDAFVVFNNSTINASDVYVSDISDDPITIFNNSSLDINDLQIQNITSAYTDVIVLFNNSDLTLKNSTFKNCPPEACVTFFDGSGYINSPSSVYIESTLFDGGLASGLLTFGDSEIVTDIKNSTFKSFTNFAIENYLLNTIKAENNDWGSISGPYHSTLNVEGEGEAIYGDVDFEPWIGQEEPAPDEYFAKVKDASNGIAQMYSEPNITSTLIKTFPNDWILKILNTTLTSDGWVKVQDMTDESFGWIKLNFKYEKNKQEEYEDSSVDNLSGSTKIDNRRSAVLNTVNHYYNDTQKAYSLYSSDDTNTISKLKTSGLPKEVILAIIASESGGGPKSGFSNEIVTYDYGHGIMQVTMDSYKHENPNYSKFGFTNNNDDPKGRFSKVRVEICKEEQSDQYKKCYENTESYNKKSKPYSHYDHDTNNPKYKQYANTVQSIYSNIKDGLGILVQKYNSALSTTFNKKNPCIEGKYRFDGYDFSCQDIVNIKTVWYYNGKSYPNPNDTNYLKLVSKNLKNLNQYFPGNIYSNEDNFIEKLSIANNHRVEIQPRSPIEVAVKDPNGNILGLLDGEEYVDMSTGAYDPDSKRAVIFFPEDSYTYEVVGDSTGGTYGLDIDIFNDSEEPVSFRSIDLPIKTGEVHTYRVDEEKLKDGDSKAVSIYIDEDGDGTVEKVIYSDNTLESLNGTPPNTSPAGAVLPTTQIIPINTVNYIKLPEVIKPELPLKQEIKKVSLKKVAFKQKPNTQKLAKKDAPEKVVQNKEVKLQANIIDAGFKKGWFRNLLKRIFNY